MRVTTNAILRNYKSNLGTSMANLNNSRNKVMTGRNFVASAEDPSSALRAAMLERKYLRNLDYLDSVHTIQSFHDAQEEAAMQINDLSLTLSKQYGLEALNATNQSPEVRKSYAEAWRGAQENMLLSLNAAYEDKYVFAGSDGGNPPFALTTDANGKQILTYRGVDVNSTDPDDLKILEEFSKDSAFIDLGFGLTDKNGDVTSSTAYDYSLPGINLIGYGQDENGNPKNMVLLAGQIADTLEAEPFDAAKFEELVGAFDIGRNKVLDQVTTLGTKTQFLDGTKERLESNKLGLEEQLDSVVNIDMADAITKYSWDQYAYNAALKVGTSILSPSFIDFMR